MSPPGTAPLRLVMKVIELRGPRGGTMHALVLECGCFVTRRLKEMQLAPERVPCVACFIRNQMTLEPIVHLATGYSSGRRPPMREFLAMCGVTLRDNDGGWTNLPQAATCPRCLAEMPIAKARRPPRRARQ